MGFLLRIFPSEGTSYKFPLKKPSVVVGRSVDCDLVIKDRAISRRHARIFIRDEQLMIEDLGSHNGTILNGDPITKPTHFKLGSEARLAGSIVQVIPAEDGEDRVGTGPLQTFSLMDAARHTVYRDASALLEISQSFEPGEPETALRKVAARLRLLNHIHHGLAATVSLESLFDLILDNVFAHLEPEQGAIFLRNSKNELEVVASRNLQDGKEHFVRSRSLIHEVTEKGKAALVFDTLTDQRFSGSESIMAAGIRSFVAAPLQDSEGGLGMIVLASNATTRQFSEEDMVLLVSISAVASLRIRNMLLSEEAANHLREYNKRLEDEVAEATKELRRRNLELHETNKNLLETREKLVMQEKLAALGNLTAGVAHEINTPIGVGITACSHLLDKTQDLEALLKEGEISYEDLQTYLTRTVQSASLALNNLRKAGQLVKSFKQLAEDQTSGVKRNFNVKTYIENVLLNLGSILSGHEHSIQVDGPPDLEIESFPGGISQIISALVANAIIHGYDPNTKAEIQIKFGKQEDIFWLQCRDEGKGIAPENLDKVFEPFFTTRRGKGSIGLGLHLLFNLINQRLSGQISCKSKVGEGTKFEVRFPV